MSAASQRSTPPRPDEAGPIAPAPRPLPSDPKERQALLAHLERGIADVRGGRLVNWEDIDREVRAKYGLTRG